MSQEIPKDVKNVQLTTQECRDLRTILNDWYEAVDNIKRDAFDNVDDYREHLRMIKVARRIEAILHLQLES